jgi:hypothetical protein
MFAVMTQNISQISVLACWSLDDKKTVMLMQPRMVPPIFGGYEYSALKSFN